MVERSQDRLQYYDANCPTNVTIPAVDIKKKELRFPGLKSFKSASMRLPGQKSSIAEVQQLLRVKFNRINIGLRKRRALSVQEVFNHPRTGSQPSAPPTSTITESSAPSQFYVPSPLMGHVLRSKHHHTINNNNCNDTTEAESSGPSSLPYFVNHTTNAQDDANHLGTPTKDINRAKPTPTAIARSTTLLRRSHSNNYHGNAPAVVTVHRKTLAPNDLGEQTTQITSKTPPPRKTHYINRISVASSATPQFLVGGSVTPPSYTPRRLKHQVTATADGASSAEPKIRLRPRSHSPLKTADNDQLRTTRKKRESFGFFERINRMMGNNNNNQSNHSLPPPHNNTNGRLPSNTTSPSMRNNNICASRINNENNPNQSNSSATIPNKNTTAQLASPTAPSTALRSKASPTSSGTTTTRNIKNLTLNVASSSPSEPTPANVPSDTISSNDKLRRNSHSSLLHQQPDISLLRDRMTAQQPAPKNNRQLLQVRTCRFNLFGFFTHTHTHTHGVLFRCNSTYGWSRE